MNMTDPLEVSHAAIKSSNMRPSARQALLALVLETNDRELALSIKLAREHLKARSASDALVG